MRIKRLRLENWRNFKSVDVELTPRCFVVGPNASGKSNLLDAIRFLRDIASPSGGFRRAVESDRRGGVSRLRSLYARQKSEVVVAVDVETSDGQTWRYELTFGQSSARIPEVKRERVWRGDVLVLDRPDADDKVDRQRLEQTHLEQINANKEFRPLVEGLADVEYRHVVPQIMRAPDRWRGSDEGDPFGCMFLDEIWSTADRTRKARLRQIEEAIKVSVPQFHDLDLVRDKRTGTPHLQANHKHWRPQGANMREEQFSDGTLRLIGLLWSLTSGSGPLLLEEPELSLHLGVVRHLPAMIDRATRGAGTKRRQVIVSTHSEEMLNDPGIDPDEILLLRPTTEETKVVRAGTLAVYRTMAASGLGLGAKAMADTVPERADQLHLWDVAT